ncbi:MAG TPA: ATP-binding protein [Polyangiales bacterium]|nr:ATP-binding protein [Polyangiales bacterium]
MPKSSLGLRFSIQIVLIVGCLAAHASGQSAEPDAGVSPLGAEETSAEAASAEEQALAAARERALAEANLAQTETRRLIAERRARLLSVKEGQARYTDELAEKQVELAAALESALAWNRQVRELEDSVPEGRSRGAEADRFYDALVHDLTQARQNLGSALDAVRSEPSAVPLLQAADSDRIPLDIDDGSLDELENELVGAASILQAEETKLRWDRAQTLSRAIVIMNESRLRLLDMLSEARRESLEGFGPEGIAQVKREVEQIILEARFDLLSLPREATERYEQLRSAPGPALAGFFQLFLLILGFRWWWKRADSTLEEMRRTWLQKRPQTLVTRGVSTFAWYLRRIRKPLEWLLFFAILARIIARAGQVADTKYLHIVIRWLAVGAFVVQLIDATASRQGFSTESLDKLRFRSLRLVGVSVVVVGLILSLTQTAVGKGAIYAWVASTFWFLAIPIGLILVFWWRETIFERAKARTASRFLQWVASRDHTVLMYPAAVLGGAYLLIEGIVGFFLRKISELAPLRRLLTYQMRRGVQKSTTAIPAERGTEPLPPELLEALGSGPPTAAGLVTSYMSDRVHAMRALVRSDKRAVIAVVGERGLGKTTFLGRVTSDLEPDALCSVQCQPGGFPVLLAQFARALELPEGSPEEQIIESLRQRAPRVISVDDAQRLVRPLIGGLEDFDHLTRFMRLVSPETRWLIAIGKPAWHYLRRARGDRSAFDQIVDLKPWEEPQLAALIEQRTREAGIDPSFERLVVPRQVQTVPMSDEERTKRDFYRILLDYSDGNPEVSLYWWRASLYRRPPDDTVHVRLFQGPTATQLDDLPSNFYFVLRSVVQLELAIEKDVIACTDLSPAEVADALRAAWMRGYIEDRGGFYHVDIAWYRAITGILRRKHLLFI